DALALWRARFALWRRQPETARALLTALPASPEIRCLLAVAAIQEGQFDQAETLLDTLIESDVAAEAWSWMATLRRNQRRYAEAVSAADAADVASRSFNLVNRLERELSATAIFRVPKPTRLLQSIGL